jgi:hypothetical protein
MTDAQLLEKVVSAYALRAFPYPQRELNPVRDPEDLALVSWVDGWQTARDELGEFLAERAANRQPAIMLIVGGSGTGRSSLAHTLVRLWADQRLEMSKPPVVARRLVEVSDAESELYELVLDLDARRDDAELPVSDPTAAAVQALMQQKPQAMGQALNRLLKKMSTEVRSEGSALIAILEGIDSKEFLSLAAQAFTGVDACLVMTVDDTPGNNQEVLSQAERLIDEQMSRRVRLTELTGADVRDLVQQKWQECTTGPESPFPDSGLQEAFDSPRRSLRDVLALLELLLVGKIDINQDQDRWPDCDRLGFSDSELKQRVAYLDGVIWRR